MVSKIDSIENLIARFIEFYNNVKYESMFEMCKYGRDICERLIDVFSQRQTTISTELRVKLNHFKSLFCDSIIGYYHHFLIANF
jgi:hypothetical protein